MGRWCEYARVKDPAKPGGKLVPAPSSLKLYGAVIMEVDALVDPATWQQANDAMTARAGGKNGTRKPRSAAPAMLSGGVLSCLDCGGAMYRLGDQAGRQAYYRCAGRGTRRQGCGILVRMDAVDGAVSWYISGNHGHIRERRVVPGNDWQAEIARVMFDLRALSDRHLPYAQEDAERARLRAVKDELEAREPVPDRVEEVLTDTTYAQAWAELEDARDRRAWLRKLGLTIRANRERTEIHDARGKWAAIRHDRPAELTAEMGQVFLIYERDRQE
jgi:hypothetical protein